MNLPGKHIVDYIKEQKVLTIATSEKESPYCAICFFVYNELENSLIFASKKNTVHITQAQFNPNVAGTIFNNPQNIGSIKGVQFTGEQSELTGKPLLAAKDIYYDQFPYAKVLDTCFWKVELHYIKMTNNKLGFAKKLVWSKNKTNDFVH